MASENVSAAHKVYAGVRFTGKEIGSVGKFTFKSQEYDVIHGAAGFLSPCLTVAYHGEVADKPRFTVSVLSEKQNLSTGWFYPGQIDAPDMTPINPVSQEIGISTTSFCDKYGAYPESVAELIDASWRGNLLQKLQGENFYFMDRGARVTFLQGLPLKPDDSNVETNFVVYLVGERLNPNNNTRYAGWLLYDNINLPRLLNGLEEGDDLALRLRQQSHIEEIQRGKLNRFFSYLSSARQAIGRLHIGETNRNEQNGLSILTLLAWQAMHPKIAKEA